MLVGSVLGREENRSTRRKPSHGKKRIINKLKPHMASPAEVGFKPGDEGSTQSKHLRTRRDPTTNTTHLTIINYQFVMPSLQFKHTSSLSLSFFHSATFLLGGGGGGGGGGGALSPSYGFVVGLS